MDNALELLVTEPLETYIENNFGTPFAGGTYPLAGLCGPMAAVWKHLRCQDFDIDLFLTFEDIATFDPRILPLPCTDIAARAVRWQQLMAEAYPVPSDPGDVSIPLPPLPGVPSTAGGMDAVLPYVVDMGVAGSCSASRVIPTGVQVILGSTPIPDAVCSVPGCYYDGGRCR